MPDQALGDLERAAASAAGERRDGLRLTVTGTVLLLEVASPIAYTRRGGSHTCVLAFRVWTPRGGPLWAETRRADHIALLGELREGALLKLAGQLVVRHRGIATFVTLRVYDLERVRDLT